MARLRLLAPVERRLLQLLVALAMLTRVLVPAGWMPVADAAGPRLALCDGAVAMAAMTGEHGKPPMHHQGPSDHPCAFAGAAAVVDAPMLAPPPAPGSLAYTPPSRTASAAVGQGLAAPPPPSRGPPTA